ncbi:MAG: hypothetical protein K1X86_12280 [Ignavibacteria bacterium]|nr:hypothetical protein [Ignavibacteria bacterium]
MKRIGRAEGKEIYYFHWNDERRDYYLERLPKKQRWVLFVIGDEKLNDDYRLLAEKSADEYLVGMNSAGIECELIHDIFDDVIIKKRYDKGGLTGSPDDYEGTALTSWWTDEFDWGYWMSCREMDHDEYDREIRLMICVDFTKKGVKKYLMHCTKLIRKGWIPRSGHKGELFKTKPIYDDEIKKPLRKSQKGFEKD